MTKTDYYDRCSRSSSRSVTPPRPVPVEPINLQPNFLADQIPAKSTASYACSFCYV